MGSVERAQGASYQQKNRKLSPALARIFAYLGTDVDQEGYVLGSELMEIADRTLTADATAANDFTVGTVGYLIAAGTITLADADAQASVDSLVVMALATIAGGAEGSFQLPFGKKITVASHGFTVGLPLYISATAGELTETAPTTGEYVKPVAYALDANTLLFIGSGATSDLEGYLLGNELVEVADHTLTADATAANDFVVGTVGYLIAAGTITLADADVQVSVDSLVVMSLAITVGDAEGVFQLPSGRKVTVTSHGHTVGLPLYASATAGELTETPPAAGTFLKPVAYALDANTLYFVGGGATAAQEGWEVADFVLVATAEAGDSYTVGKVGYLDSAGTITHADSDTEAATNGLLVMALATIAGGAEGSFQLPFGRKVTVTGHGFTVGAPLYVGGETVEAAGDLTTTLPSTPDFVRIVAYALDANTVYFIGNGYTVVGV